MPAPVKGRFVGPGTLPLKKQDGLSPLQLLFPAAFLSYLSAVSAVFLQENPGGCSHFLLQHLSYNLYRQFVRRFTGGYSISMLLTIGFIIYDGCTVCKTLLDEIKDKVKLKLEDYEIIIVDATSEKEPDGLSEFIEENRSSNLNAWKVKTDNNGTLEGRRSIVENARGKYIWLLDNDDHLNSDITESMFEGDYDIIQCQASIEYTDQTNTVGPLKDDERVITLTDTHDYVEYKTRNEETLFFWSKFIRATLLKSTYSIIPYMENIIWFEDDIAIFTMYKYNPRLNIHFIPVCIYDHVMSESSITNSTALTHTGKELDDYYLKQYGTLKSGIEKTLEYMWLRDKYLLLVIIQYCINYPNPYIKELAGNLLINYMLIAIT